MKTKNFHLKKVLLTFGLLACAAGGALAGETTYNFGISDQRTNISFESVTDFETVLGTTNQVSGFVKTDLDAGTAHVELEVPVASLNTGIAMRDEHLRSAGWLDAENFPTIRFVSDQATKSGDYAWTVSGDFTMHGVTKDLKTEVKVRPIPQELAQQAGLEPGAWLKVATTFELKLSDFGVKIPQMAAAKVNDTWKVTFHAYANAAPGSVALQN